MRTRVLQGMLAISILLAGLWGAIGQERPTGSSPGPQTAEKNSGTRALSQTSKTAIEGAIKSDRFELTKDEYKLERPIDVDSSPSKRDNISVDYQIGTIDGKPATVSFVIDKKKAPKEKDSKQVDAMFGVVPNQPVRIGKPEHQSLLQKCRNGRTCVKTDKDGNCIKWVCS